MLYILLPLLSTLYSLLTSISRLTTPVDLRLGFFFLWMGLSCVGVAAPLPAPSVSPPEH